MQLWRKKLLVDWLESKCGEGVRKVTNVVEEEALAASNYVPVHRKPTMGTRITPSLTDFPLVAKGERPSL